MISVRCTYGRFIVFADVAGNLWDLIDAPGAAR